MSSDLGLPKNEELYVCMYVCALVRECERARACAHVFAYTAILSKIYEAKRLEVYVGVVGRGGRLVGRNNWGTISGETSWGETSKEGNVWI